MIYAFSTQLFQQHPAPSSKKQKKNIIHAELNKDASVWN